MAVRKGQANSVRRAGGQKGMPTLAGGIKKGIKMAKDNERTIRKVAHFASYTPLAPVGKAVEAVLDSKDLIEENIGRIRRGKRKLIEGGQLLKSNVNEARAKLQRGGLGGLSGAAAAASSLGMGARR